MGRHCYGCGGEVPMSAAFCECSPFYVEEGDEVVVPEDVQEEDEGGEGAIRGGEVEREAGEIAERLGTMSRK